MLCPCDSFRNRQLPPDPTQSNFEQDLHFCVKPCYPQSANTSPPKPLLSICNAPHGFAHCLRLLQVGLLEPIGTQIDSKLAPSCLSLGSSWDQVAPKLVPVEARLAPNPVLGGSWGPPRARRRSRKPQGYKNGDFLKLPNEPKFDPKS